LLCAKLGVGIDRGVDPKNNRAATRAALKNLLFFVITVVTIIIV
jgi:hypothetical protein